MLLEFTTKNYKSFCGETKFSMLAAPKQKGLDYSLYTAKIGGKFVKGLCSSVIYGPNAAGKTNIIGAMDVFRAIVLRGNIRNSEDKSSPNNAASDLELIPNNKSTDSQPVEFSADFLENGLRIRYSISADLGTFLDNAYPRRILSETLSVNDNMVFFRNEGLTFGNLSTIKPYLASAIVQNPENTKEIAQNSLSQDELFLVNGFKLILSQTLTKLIIDWFTNKFMVIYRADSMQLVKRFSDPQKKAVYIEKTTDEAARLFGINSNAVSYVVNDEDAEAKLCSIFENIEIKKYRYGCRNF